ncbi:MAG: hypothetical protein JWM10_4146 [Myxococcaceae bacterium]|nr:hypothetical protein [Myxococcaceae bacterium]
MPRKATGTIVWANDHWRARIRLADGTRPWVDLPRGLSEAQARKKAQELTTRARTLGATRDNKGGDLAAATESVREWSVRWIVERERRGIRSVRNDQSRLDTHILPVFGNQPIRAVVRADVEGFVERLDRKVQGETLSWKTALNIWTLLCAMFRDASASKSRALRVRDDNPCANVSPPDRGGKKSKVYLFPSEFLRLMECEGVSVQWRRLVAVAIYLYARAGELQALHWEDLDLDHGVVQIHRAFDRDRDVEKETKGEEARRFNIEPALLPLLREMRAQVKGSKVFPEFPQENELAEELRRYLKIAGVSRGELYASDRTRKNMTFHDLRATGITWMAVRGDAPIKIQRCAGHKSFATTDGYIREAVVVSDGFGSPFPPLPRSLYADGRGAGGAEEEAAPANGPRNGPPEMANGPEPQRFRAVTLVRGGGLEPPRCYSLAPQASASANSAILAAGRGVCPVSPSPVNKFFHDAARPSRGRCL